jgi:hypothetical protein
MTVLLNQGGLLRAIRPRLVKQRGFGETASKQTGQHLPARQIPARELLNSGRQIALV